MSSAVAPTAAEYRWQGDGLELLEYCGPGDLVVHAADSWLVADAKALALGLHRDRFARAVADAPLGAPSASPLGGAAGDLSLDAFWRSSVAMIPLTGDWFPRVELQVRRGAPLLVFRQRSAPTRSRSVTLATHDGPDPRTRPRVKGPDLERMRGVRAAAHRRGAGEAVILSSNGFVVEGGYSAIVWWRGETLCLPAIELDRIDSVTVKTVVTLAQALGVDVAYESVVPSDLDGLEVWALNALHGIRVVTAWIDGPQLAEEPGRAETWRRRLGKLSRPIATLGS